MRKKLRLIHLANFNSSNIGNGALISGLENLISEDFDVQIEWIREAWDDYTFGFKFFDENFVDLVNSSDGLIVNGAVTIHGREYLKETGMRFELSLSLIEKVKKPIVFYGISYRHFREQVFYNAETLKKYIKALTDNSNIFFGVRNDGTRKWMDGTLGLGQESLRNIYEVPDTGVFTDADSGYYPEILNDKKIIIFAPNDEDAVFRFSNDNVQHVRQTGYQLPENNLEVKPDNSWIENRNKLVVNIKNVLTKIIEDFDCQLLIVPHYLDDYKFIASLVEAFKPQIAHQSSISTGLMRVQGTEYFYGRYVRSDLAISMRVHSMSPCIGLGVPMIPLITQPRMWDFLQETGLADLGQDAFSENFEQEMIENAFDILNDPTDRIERFNKAKDRMRNITRDLNSRIEKMFI